MLGLGVLPVQGPLAKKPTVKEDGDLPVPNVNNKKDKYEAFAISLPFCRINIKKYEQQIKDAHKACGNEGWVTLEELAKVFTTPAWAGLSDESSKLSRVLLSHAFCEDEGRIKVEALYVMGVLCCPDPPNVKAFSLYNVLQDGGIQENEFIAAGDKDFPPTWNLLVKLSTVHLFEWCKTIDDYDGPFTEDQQQSLVDCVDDHLDDFLDIVFGDEAKLSYKDFITKSIEKKANYIYDINSMRASVFTFAKVPYSF